MGMRISFLEGLLFHLEPASLFLLAEVGLQLVDKEVAALVEILSRYFLFACDPN